jgi:hypothetical protein
VAAPDADDLEESEPLRLTRAELLAAAGRGEMPLLTQVALLALVTNPALAAGAAKALWPSGSAADQPTLPQEGGDDRFTGHSPHPLGPQETAGTDSPPAKGSPR